MSHIKKGAQLLHYAPSLLRLNRLTDRIKIVTKENKSQNLNSGTAIKPVEL